MKKEDLHRLKLLLKVFRYSFIINYAIFGKLYVMNNESIKKICQLAV